MRNLVSMLAVATIASVLTLLGSNLATSAAEGPTVVPPTCAVTPETCPSPLYVARNDPPGNRIVRLNLPDGRYLVWADVHVHIHEVDTTPPLTGCNVIQDKGTSAQKVVLSPAQGIASYPVEARYGAVDVNLWLPYRPAIVQVPQAGLAPPEVLPPRSSRTPQAVARSTLEADCVVRLAGTPRGSPAQARLYALRLG